MLGHSSTDHSPGSYTPTQGIPCPCVQAQPHGPQAWLPHNTSQWLEPGTVPPGPQHVFPPPQAEASMGSHLWWVGVAVGQNIGIMPAHKQPCDLHGSATAFLGHGHLRRYKTFMTHRVKRIQGPRVLRVCGGIQARARRQMPLEASGVGGVWTDMAGGWGCACLCLVANQGWPMISAVLSSA